MIRTLLLSDIRRLYPYMMRDGHLRLVTEREQVLHALRHPPSPSQVIPLFLCRHNAKQSQIAQTITEQTFKRQAFSAGSIPIRSGVINPLVEELLLNKQHDSKRLVSKHIIPELIPIITHIIHCYEGDERVKETRIPTIPPTIYWNFATSTTMEQLYKQIESNVESFLMEEEPNLSFSSDEQVFNWI